MGAEEKRQGYPPDPDLYRRDPRRLNIAAARLVAEMVRSTLGPKGMDKMLVGASGDVIVTNDGVTILDQMRIEHPAARMLVEVARTQEAQIGDGTTTAVIIAGELLRKAEELLDQGIHPTLITKVYRAAREQAGQILRQLARHIDPSERKLLFSIAQTAMTGKGAEMSKEHLSSLVVDATLRIIKHKGERPRRESISVVGHVGAGVEQSEIIDGILIEKGRLHPSMPERISPARIAILTNGIEVRRTETEARISITDPRHLEAFSTMEERMLKEMIERIAASGANVVLCQRGVDELAQHHLAKRGIYTIRRVDRSQLERIAQACDASIVASDEELDSAALGRAKTLEQMRLGDAVWTCIRESARPTIATVLIRGGSEQIVSEVRRAIEDSIGDLILTLNSPDVVCGAGSVEIELARRLRRWSEKQQGRERLIAHAFADAMEVVPRTLAENAGLDVIDALNRLNVRHDQGDESAGLDVFTGEVLDAWDQGVIEPVGIKQQALSAAYEVAALLLRIDDVIACGEPPKQTPGDALD